MLTAQSDHYKSSVAVTAPPSGTNTVQVSGVRLDTNDYHGSTRSGQLEALVMGVAMKSGDSDQSTSGSHIVTPGGEDTAAVPQPPPPSPFETVDIESLGHSTKNAAAVPHGLVARHGGGGVPGLNSEDEGADGGNPPRAMRMSERGLKETLSQAGNAPPPRIPGLGSIARLPSSDTRSGRTLERSQMGSGAGTEGAASRRGWTPTALRDGDGRSSPAAFQPFVRERTKESKQ